MRLALYCLMSVAWLFSCHAAANASTPNQAAIASPHPWATDAGMAVLKDGGNAFDAAITVAAVLSVVEPYSSGMGGGGFWLLHQEQDEGARQVFLDARETAPLKAHDALFQDDDGKVIRDRAINSALSAGIPGQAAAFDHLATHYGRLPLSRTLAPAIAAAQDGFPVDSRYQLLAGFRLEVLNRFPDTAALFLVDGDIPEEGTVIRQPDLANTLRAVAQHGRDGFYNGDVAKQLLAGVNAAGGIWQQADFDQYRVVERQPLITPFRGARIVSAPPPSSGGVVIAQIMQMLSSFNDGEISNELRPHLLVEAMRRSYRDRALYLGDPDFVDNTVDKLLSPVHINRLSRSIRLDQATDSADLGPAVELPQGDHTTHFSILDQQGNRVAATLSINLPFGNGMVIPGTGVVLNNEMDDFSSAPGSPNEYGLVGSHANAIEPGKRPLSSMTPTFVEWDDQVAILGTPGGSRIITMVTLGILAALDGMPVEHWVSEPRFHHQYLPDRVQIEPAFADTPAAKGLQLRGHQLHSIGRQYGNMQAIHWHRGNNSVTAASDPRGIGESSVSEQ